MKTTIASIALVSVLALAPGLAMAKTINGQLTPTQIGSYCSGATATSGSTGTFDLGNGKTLTGKVDCSIGDQTSISAANGIDDHGTESGNDADSTHED